ncbi:hypothetical protein ACFLXP_03095 [Chloroflexota bacterium]
MKNYFCGNTQRNDACFYGLGEVHSGWRSDANTGDVLQYGGIGSESFPVLICFCAVKG